jgi:hypothetical protein
MKATAEAPKPSYSTTCYGPRIQSGKDIIRDTDEFNFQGMERLTPNFRVGPTNGDPAAASAKMEEEDILPA